MVMLRSKSRGIAAFLLGVMLFAQAAIALAGCNAGREPARAMHHAMDGMGDMVCCAEEGAESPAPANANLCLAHCTSDAQSPDSYVPPAIVAPAVAPLTVPPADGGVAFALRRQEAVVRGIASPPLTILFRNFRA